MTRKLLRPSFGSMEGLACLGTAIPCHDPLYPAVNLTLNTATLLKPTCTLDPPTQSSHSFFHFNSHIDCTHHLGTACQQRASTAQPSKQPGKPLQG